MKNINLIELNQELEQIVRRAGAILLDYFYAKNFSVQQKKDHSLVTDADKASEQYLIRELGRLLPTAGIVAEESGAASGSSEYTWVIDPLDGTTNFAHGVPYFCVSVALVVNHEPVVGFIYQPLLDELFSAHKGHGAFLNGQKMQVSPSGTMLLIALSSVADEQYEQLLAKLDTIAGPGAYTTRHLGAGALDMAYVACGRMDGLFSTGLAWWDVAAGMLLVAEAGGIVTDSQGQKLTPDYKSCVAAGPWLQTRMLPMLEC